MTDRFFSFAAAALLASCTATPDVAQKTTSQETTGPQIKTGNGEHNYIILDGASRNGSTFTFREVAIDKPGWLVMHPFENGEPARTVYVGAAALEEGRQSDVDITIDVAPQKGDMFIVMLHYDVNRDGVFDFNDGVTVPDAPVFEGNTLVALRYIVE